MSRQTDDTRDDEAWEATPVTALNLSALDELERQLAYLHWRSKFYEGHKMTAAEYQETLERLQRLTKRVRGEL